MRKTIITLLLLLAGCRSGHDHVSEDMPEVIPLDPLQFVGVESKALCAAKFPCQKFLDMSYYSFAPAINFLWATFQPAGEEKDCQCADWAIAYFKDAPFVFKVEAINGPYMRSDSEKRPQEFMGGISDERFCSGLRNRDPQILAAYRKRISDIVQFIEARRAPGMIPQILPVLEDDCTDAEMSIAISEARKLVGTIALVRNPVGSGTAAGADYLERHHNGPADIISEDGILHSVEQFKNLVTSNPESYVVLRWLPALQGRKVDPDGDILPATDPLTRTFELTDEEAKENADTLFELTFPGELNVPE